MKKILFYAVAIAAAATSCSDIAEDITPEVGGGNGMITINASSSDLSKAAVQSDWTIFWEAEDALLGFNANGEEKKFSLADGVGTTAASFTGELPNNDFLLIYPYSLIDARLSTGSTNFNFNLDISTQQEGINYNYMVSESMIAYTATDISLSMLHIGAAVEVDMTFEDSSYDGYTIESVEVTNLNSTGSFEAEGKYFYGNTATTITITDGVTAVASQAATVGFNIFPTVIAANGSITVTAYLKSAEGTSVTFAKTITTDVEANFARAQHHTIPCAFIADDVVVPYWTGYAADSFSGSGDGSSSDSPYEIASAEELALIAKNVNAGTETYSGKYFKLTQSIDLTGYKWEAIGNSSTKSFQGSFDGNNKTISGLYINESSSYQGLFGYITNYATVKNLSVSGTVINSGYYTAGIVGNSSNSSNTITNCHNNCSVTTNGSYSYTGGVVGYNSGTLSDCSNSGKIEGNNDVGGVAGSSYNAIEGCYNTGVIDGTKYVGGVAGYNNSGNILNSYNTASVTGTGDYVGGVVGYFYSGSRSDRYIYNSYNRGSVKGANYVGGVVGECEGYYDAYNIDFSMTSTTCYSKIQNCYSASSVTATGSNIGGVVGSIATYGSVSYSYWDSGLYSGSETGRGTGYSTADMTDGTTVLGLLNGQVSSIEGAEDWVQGTDSYPTLDL